MDLKRISYIILYASMIYVPTKTDCPEHTFNINSEEVTWPASPISDLWIPSDCLDENRLLIFRQCLDDGWTPNNDEVEAQCKEKMNPVALKCPANLDMVPNQRPSSRTICYRLWSYMPTADTTCIEGNIEFMELSVDEQSELIAALLENIETQRTFVLRGRNRWPNKPISSYINNETEDIELQNIGCGRFGLPLTFSKNSVAVTCAEGDVCDNMCLSLNVTKEPFSADVTIEKCSSDTLQLHIYPFQQKNTLMCSSGWYQGKLELWKCFSIQVFPQPIPIVDIETENVRESFCEGDFRGDFKTIKGINDMFVFRQLNEEVKLKDGHNCLFSMTASSPKELVKFSDWNSYDTSQIASIHLNWDKAMNYSRITKDSSYLAVNPNGQWTWAVDTVTCVVCEEIHTIYDPTITMQYKFLERKLEIDVLLKEFFHSVRNPDPGFNCFALIGESYKADLKIYPIAGSSDKYLIENVGMGQYWCSGNQIGESVLITSTAIYAYGIVYAFEVVRNCTSYCSYSPDDLDNFHEVFQQNFDFLLIKEFAFVANESFATEMGYTFTVQLSLTLQEHTIIDLDTNLVNLTEYQIETVFIHEQLNKMLAVDSLFNRTKSMRRFGIQKLLDDESSEYTIRSFISTEFCLHESTLSMDAIIWRIAYLNETISPSLLCPDHETNAKITRTCRGDSIRGLYWEDLVNPPDCFTVVSQALLALYISSYSNPASEVVENLTSILETNIPRLLPVDVIITSRILHKVSNETFLDLGNIFSIYNSLMKVDEDYLKISALFNSTNILLEALDNVLLNHIDSYIIAHLEPPVIIRSINYTTYGNASINSALLKTFILNPTTSGVSGVVLYRSRNSSISDDDFTDYSYRYVDPHETIDELFNNSVTDKDIVVGSYLPTDMLTSLTNVNVVINAFFNDKLFQPSEMLSEKHFQANGKIIAITILGLPQNGQLPTKIPIFFESKLSDNTSCGYWNFESVTGWSTKGCDLRKVFTNDFQSVTVCDCTHLTHFGCLINGNLNEHFQRHERTLTIITIIGSTFSLFGTLGIFITAAVFEKWRRKLSSKILLHFSASITLEMFLMIFINLDDRLLSSIVSNPIKCATVGAILHYSVLSMYFWMLIIAYFQFKRYVVVFNFSVSHMLLKSTIFAWGAPLLPIIAVLIIDHSLYLPINKDELKLCYPNGWALYVGVIAPIALIFLVNLIVFVAVIVSLLRGFSKSICNDEASKYAMRLSQIRLFGFLFFTLGLTWVFGFLSTINLLFSYLFCITATIQGMVLFLYFVVKDPNIRGLWVKFIRSRVCRE